MTARDLVMRDVALAAVMGALPGADFGVDFGYQTSFGDEQAAAEAWKAQQDRTQKREHLLEPNRGSAAKIQRYTFSLNATIAALATPQPGLSANGAPDTNFRPQRVVINTPFVGFLLLRGLRVANVAVLVGGIADGHQFNPNAVGSDLDLPTLSPANRAAFDAEYTGTVPAPLVGTDPYLLAVGFTGPASIVA
jgi:hypothetical protein